MDLFIIGFYFLPTNIYPKFAFLGNTVRRIKSKVKFSMPAIQGLLWKSKRGVTTSWKKHWVYVDDEYFMQWTNKTKPNPDEQPKYQIEIRNCRVQPSTARKFAFEIIEISTGKSMTFAADDSTSFKKWMKILPSNELSPPSSPKGNKDQKKILVEVLRKEEESMLSNQEKQQEEEEVKLENLVHPAEQLLMTTIMNDKESNVGKVSLQAIEAAMMKLNSHWNIERLLLFFRTHLHVYPGNNHNNNNDNNNNNINHS
jgi:hypothetical protein